MKNAMKDGASAINDLIKYKDGIDLMGDFGRLFLSYPGDRRGPIGRAGEGSLLDEAQIMPTMKDVDGGIWRPVLEDVLKDLISCAENAEALAEKKIKQLTPCDRCAYDPPSSGDGKPCSLCPASKKEE